MAEYEILKEKQNRYGHTSSLLNNKLFIFGGIIESTNQITTDYIIYDFQTKEFLHFVDAKNKARAYHSCAVDSTKNMLYFFGGKFKSERRNKILKFEADKREFSELDSITSPPAILYGHSSVFFMGKILILGGFDEESGMVNDDLLEFDIAEKTWRKYPVNIPGRYFHKSLLVEERYWMIFHGLSNSRRFLEDVWKIDFGENNNNNSARSGEIDFRSFKIKLNKKFGHKSKKKCKRQCYGQECFFMKDQIFVYGIANDKNVEIYKFVQSEKKKHHAVWKEMSFPFDKNLFHSFGTITPYKNKIYFFGGKRIKEKVRVSEDLPDDCVYYIFQFLERRDFLSLSECSKTWKFSILSSTNYVWDPILEKISLSSKNKNSLKRNSKEMVLKLNLKATKLYNSEQFNTIVLIKKLDIIGKHFVNPGFSPKKYEKEIVISSHLSKKRKENIDIFSVTKPISLKIMIIGGGGVGKSCMVLQNENGNNKFIEIYAPTVFDNFHHSLKIWKNTFNLGVWDTSGIEEFDRLRPINYPETDVFVICFSVIDPESFDEVFEKWIPETQHYEPGIPIIIVGTKNDKREEMERNGQRTVSFERACERIKQCSTVQFYVENSAKTQNNIKHTFQLSVVSAIMSWNDYELPKSIFVDEKKCLLQ